MLKCIFFVVKVFFSFVKLNALVKKVLVISGILWSLAAGAAFAQQQQTYALDISSTGQLPEGFTSPSFATDSAGVWQKLGDFLTSLHSRGYLTASVDSLNWQAHQVNARLHIGPVFRLARLSAGNVPPDMLAYAGKQEKLLRQKPFHYKQVSQLMTQVLDYATTHGYPFARLKLDSLSIESDMLSARLDYNSGPLITFDTLEIHGSEKVDPMFLAAYLGIKPGERFNQQRLETLKYKLDELLFVKQSSPYRLSFQNEQASLHLYLEDVKADQADGLLSVFTDPADDNKLKLSGQFNLQLNNLFRSGRELHMKWRRWRNASQELEVAYAHPALFRSPLSAGAKAQIVKQDTTFLEVNLRASFGWQNYSGSRFTVFTEKYSSDLLSDSENPAYRNIDQLNYGLEWQFNRLNNRLFPTQGHALHLKASLGDKRLGQLLAADNQSSERQLQYQLEASAAMYWPVSSRWLLMSRLQGGAKFNADLYANELFRLGGFEQLRGFNENQFRASAFGLSALEVRFLMEAASYLFLFYDQGVLHHPVQQTEIYPAGIGAGLSFATQAGIFRLAYALGAGAEQAMSFESSKVHFGFTGRF